MLSVLIRPKLLSIKNRWRRNSEGKTQNTRDVVLLIFAVCVMIAIYTGMHESLLKIKGTALAYVPPSMPLGLALLLLFVMLIFSNAVTALSSLFLSHDLDLLIGSPLSRWKLFCAKFFEICAGSSWMAIVFGLPVILAFGRAYHAPIEYYFLALLAFIPYFILPSALAIFCVVVFARMVPANRTREVILVIFAFVLMGLYLVFKILAPEESELQNFNHLLKLLSLLSLPTTHWAPSYWVAVCLGEVLEPTHKNYFPHLLLLISSSIAVSALAFIGFKSFYYEAYSKAKSAKGGIKLHSRRAQRMLRILTPMLPPRFRALMSKEIKVFTRDVTQTVQLLLLLGLCTIYLYNFKVLNAVQNLPEGTRLWWQGFLTISNLGMGGFVVTAVGTRFVFPSVSLEGQSFWLLQSSPMPIKEVLRAKFWCWFIPVGLMSSVIFVSGAFAINAEPHIVAVSAVASWIICYGVVGLGVGLGAFFANFTWEHSSQLAASFGSLIYMLLSSMLIVLSLIPTATLIFLRTLREMGHVIGPFEWWACVGSCSTLLVYFNFAACRWALNLGEQSLTAKMK